MDCYLEKSDYLEYLYFLKNKNELGLLEHTMDVNLEETREWGLNFNQFLGDLDDSAKKNANRSGSVVEVSPNRDVKEKAFYVLNEYKNNLTNLFSNFLPLNFLIAILFFLNSKLFFFFIKFIERGFKIFIFT